MYLIANISGNELSVSDLNITIPPRQGRDLDKIPSIKGNPRDSADLQKAKSLRLIKIIKDDGSGTAPRKKKKEVIKEKITEKTIIKEVPSGIDQKALMDFIRKEIAKNKQSPQVVQTETSNDSGLMLRAMMNKMDKILQQKQNVDTPVDGEEIDYDIDPDALSEIHRKRVDRLVENSENKIEYKKESTEDTFTEKDLDELADLL